MRKKRFRVIGLLKQLTEIFRVNKRDLYVIDVKGDYMVILAKKPSSIKLC